MLKKRLLLAFAFVLVGLTATARPVDPEAAARVATNFWNAHRDAGVAALVAPMQQQKLPFDGMYLFTAGEQGFVLVAADDRVQPVLGYSFHSPATGELNPEVAYWLEGYQAQIDDLRAAGGGETHPGWAAYSRAPQGAPVPLTVVSPLLTTTWNQAPYYNDLCPYDANESSYYNHRVVTGCVATATAQVMKYHAHPATGYGSHSYTHYNYGMQSANFGTTTYSWSNMPNALTSASSSTQKTAVATLMYHVGVADEMDYDLSANGGSGAQNYNYFGTISPSSQTSLMKYFKYRPDMSVLWRDDYSESEYASRLQAELDQSRPILYSGRNTSGGHSFVCDGYNSSGQFHFNWGWGGSHDGYFTMGSLNPGVGGIGGNSSGTYNMNNAVLMGIRPNTNWSTTGTTTITASTVTGGSVSGTGSYAFGDTVTLTATAATGYRFDGWSDGTKFNPRELIANGGSYNFTPVFTSITADTVTYCTGNRYFYSYGYSGSTKYWGIKIPAASLPAGDSLHAVQVYIPEEGTYTMTVYTGASHSNTAASGTVSFSSSDAGQWQTLYLNTPVYTTEDLWIIFSCSDVDYPIAVTYYSGAANSFLYSSVSMSSLTDFSSYWQLSVMVKAIFGSGTGGGGGTPATECYITSFPYTENFDDTSTYSCLRLIDGNGDGESWGVIDSFGTGYSRAAYIMYAVSADDWLVLPSITDAGSYTISWKARAYHSSYPESYQVYAGDTMVFSETLSTTTLTSRSATFTVAAGDTVAPMFRYISDDQYAFFLDDITISQSSGPGPTQYTLTVQSNNTAWGTVTGGGTYASGATATLTATAYTGYHFVQWQDGNTSATRTVTVTADATYTATFAEDATPSVADTVSYCGNSAYASTIGAGGTLYWGIKLTSSQLASANYLKSVMLYVTAPGSYTLRVHRGGTSAPGTLAHTQTVTFGAADTLWQEILLDATFALTSGQDIWITFYNTGISYPAASCDYTGDANSDWTSLDDSSWDHLQSLASTLTYSWLIKAVTTNTAPVLPAPTVSISGPTSFTTGVAQTFTATATTGATVTWSLAGATPSTATGSSATATWSTPGTYNVIATASNSSGSSSDTLTVNVISCGNIVSFPYVLTFDAAGLSQFACWTVLDADNDGYSWTVTDLPGTITGAIGSASYINNIGALTPDNWLISPQIQFAAGSNYTLSWQVWAPDASYYAEHYGVYVSTTGTTTTDFTLVQDYTMTTADTTNMTLDLSSYAGQNIHIAFRHWNVTDYYWMMINHITLTQTAIPGQNYTITVQSADPSMGTVTGGGTYTSGSTVTISATANSGYHFTQWNDGNTANPRTVTVTGNATYIANFAADEPTQYTITVLANNDEWGNVTGGGTYTAGSVITIRAIAYNGYQFDQWNDGNTNDTRNITVTGNATYIATFSASTGIDGVDAEQWVVYPNPASDMVTFGGMERATVTVTDLTGRVVATASVGDGGTMDVSMLPSDTYFFSIATDGTTAVRKVIVKH